VLTTALNTALSSYLTTANASSTYATQTSLNSYVLTSAQNTALTSYLTTYIASSTYATQTALNSYVLTTALNIALASYLTTANASSTYATQTALATYALKASPTFTGTITIPALTLSGIVAGTAASSSSYLALNASNQIVLVSGGSGGSGGSSATITPTASNTNYNLVGTSLTSGSLSIASIDNTSRFYFNPSSGILFAPGITTTGTSTIAGYLTTASAASTYASITSLANYLPLAGGTMNGNLILGSGFLKSSGALEFQVNTSTSVLKLTSTDISSIGVPILITGMSTSQNPVQNSFGYGLGDRFVLRVGDVNTYPISLGINVNDMWYSTNTGKHIFYINLVNRLEITSTTSTFTGNLSASGNLILTGYTASTATNTQLLCMNTSGGASVSTTSNPYLNGMTINNSGFATSILFQITPGSVYSQIYLADTAGTPFSGIRAGDIVLWQRTVNGNVWLNGGASGNVYTAISNTRITTVNNNGLGIKTTTPIGNLSVYQDGTGVDNPSAWTSAYALFGSGAGSSTGNCVGITYSDAGMYGALICLQPSVQWRDMHYAAKNHYFSVGGDVEYKLFIQSNAIDARVNFYSRGETYLSSWLRITNNDTGIYWENLGRGVTSTNSSSYGNISTYGTGKNSWSGYDIGTRFTFMANGNNVGIHDTSHSWVWRAESGVVMFDRPDIRFNAISNQTTYFNQVLIGQNGSGVQWGQMQTSPYNFAGTWNNGVSFNNTFYKATDYSTLRISGWGTGWVGGASWMYMYVRIYNNNTGVYYYASSQNFTNVGSNHTIMPINQIWNGGIPAGTYSVYVYAGNINSDANDSFNITITIHP